VEIFAYLYCSDQDTFLEIQEELLRRIADIVTACGTAFAFPSQTTYFTHGKGIATYVAQDMGADAEHGRVA